MKRVRRYLFTINGLGGGGAERVLSFIANKLVKNGNSVSIIITRERTETDYYYDSRVMIRQIDYKKRPNYIDKFSRVFKYVKIVKSAKPDVTISFIETTMIPTWIASKICNIPFVLSIRNNPWVIPPQKSRRYIRDYIAKYSNLVFVQNNEQAVYFAERKIKGRCKVLSNPVSDNLVNAERKVYSDKICRIISIGRLHPQKNQELLLKAFSMVCKANKSIKLEIFGEGEDKQRLENEIKKLKIENNVQLCGWINDVGKILKNADLYILSSNYEGMPNSLMEAMICGVPCISSDCLTGPKTLIRDHDNGLLFLSGDHEDLYNKIMWAIQNPEQMNEMGKRARDEIRNKYTLDHTMIEFYSGIQEILNY